jgi:hypothetical protein
LAFLFVFLTASLNWQCTSEPGPKYGASLEPPDGTQMYMAHFRSFQYELDSVFPNLSGISYPTGIVFFAAFNKTLSEKINGSRDLTQILPILDQHPGMIPVLVSYLDKSLLVDIVQGQFDQQIFEFGTFLKELDRPIYLNLGFEVSNPRLEIDPGEYQDAYRYIVRKFMNNGVSNVSYVWYVNGMLPNYQRRDVADWYPGDAYVNWIGTSVYKLTEPHYATKEVFGGPNYDRLMEFAREKDLPVMIVESGTKPIHSFYENDGEELWEFWYEPYLEFLDENPEIKAFAMMHEDLGDPVIERRWKEAMQKKNWTYGSASLWEQLQYQK